jgi:protein associated with RNAse G/E
MCFSFINTRLCLLEGSMVMEVFANFIIKSFKHDGHLHRMWMENWLVPTHLLQPEHAVEAMLVLVNSHTKIREADGRDWISKIPVVCFFIPGQWYNIVALLESAGIRYYCNIASPVYRSNDVLTYIDYDLDIILSSGGERQIVDQDEYERHKINYHYSKIVETKVQEGLDGLNHRIDDKLPPFQDEHVWAYYELWKHMKTGV